jgi:hypothetical protein
VDSKTSLCLLEPLNMIPDPGAPSHLETLEDEFTKLQAKIIPY